MKKNIDANINCPEAIHRVANVPKLNPVIHLFVNFDNLLLGKGTTVSCATAPAHISTDKISLWFLMKMLVTSLVSMHGAVGSCDPKKPQFV